MKKTTTENQASFDKINAALVDFRVEYRARYVAAFTTRLERLKATLKAVNGDINKSHPYPSSNMSRKFYVQAKNEYEWAHRVTENPPLGEAPYDEMVDYGVRKNLVRRQTYRIGDPHYVQIKQSAYDTATKDAIKAADTSIDGYIWKLVGKIEKNINTAAYSGYLWDGSILNVDCGDEQQTWKTKCILNVSCLGTVFNQWPTRRVS